VNQESLTKILFYIVIGINLEAYINTFLVNFLIIIPLSFLIYSYFVYKSNIAFSATASFFIGIFVDLISGTYIGLNALVYLITTYIINSYKYVFRLFSYLQISIFFGIIATVYIGLTHLFINISNYSYLILFASFVTNSILSFILSVIRVYRPIFFRNRRL
jgi:rod shape-determining protein MreD